MSLPVVESLVLAGNHIYENGPNAADPVCGVFIGYGNDLEVTDIARDANLSSTAAYDDIQHKAAAAPAVRQMSSVPP